MRIPPFYRRVSAIASDHRRAQQHTTVIGITGAFGKMNLVSENFERRRQFSARSIHPAPSSPKPWTKITVAVCLATAGTTSGADMIIELMIVNLE